MSAYSVQFCKPGAVNSMPFLLDIKSSVWVTPARGSGCLGYDLGPVKCPRYR